MKLEMDGYTAQDVNGPQGRIIRISGPHIRPAFPVEYALDEAEAKRAGLEAVLHDAISYTLRKIVLPQLAEAYVAFKTTAETCIRNREREVSELRVENAALRAKRCVSTRRAWQLRRERRVFRDAAEQAIDQRGALQTRLREAEDCTRGLSRAEESARLRLRRTEELLDHETEAKAKAIRGRRRALLLARDFQQRLYAEYANVDRYAARLRAARAAA